jgi:hypothetical protein
VTIGKYRFYARNHPNNTGTGGYGAAETVSIPAKDASRRFDCGLHAGRPGWFPMADASAFHYAIAIDMIILKIAASQQGRGD